MTKDYRSAAAAIPAEERPISSKAVSGIGNFFGLYGGEHIAATEFVIGATLVTWGVRASDIFIGLIIGNILATLTYALICAPIAVDTRMTLYAYLKKVVGPYYQKIYNVVWGLASIAMAASMLTVSASAVREIFHVPIQTNWYPTSIKFIFIVIVLGIVVTFVAANGFEAVAKFSSVCAPWMIVAFFCGAAVALPQLVQATGFHDVKSVGDFLELCNTSVWNGEVEPGGTHLTVFHVAAFAWQCNLAYHGGLNDMSLFRFAKRKEYGYVPAFGMFVGHFFAWCCAGIMGATAAILLNTSLSQLDSGAVTNTVLGAMGLLAVIIAGWTTANPSIYRASLSYETIFPKLGNKKLTYIVGILMTVAACFPITANVMTIVNIIVLIVPAVGAICIAEHWILPKLGGTRYWSMYRGDKVNKAALLAWGISLAFVVVMKLGNFIHSYMLFLPTYILAIVVYLFLALRMGAKDDYSEQVEDYIRTQEELTKIIDEEAMRAKPQHVVIPGYTKLTQPVSWVILAVIFIMAIMTLTGSLAVVNFKTYAFALTIVYFVLGAITTYGKFYSKSARGVA